MILNQVDIGLKLTAGEGNIGHGAFVHLVSPQKSNREAGVMAHFLAAVHLSFDFVVVDSPPEGSETT